jgi:hypothetical protein
LRGVRHVVCLLRADPRLPPLTRWSCIVLGVLRCWCRVTPASSSSCLKPSCMVSVWLQSFVSCPTYSCMVFSSPTPSVVVVPCAVVVWSLLADCKLVSAAAPTRHRSSGRPRCGRTTGPCTYKRRCWAATTPSGAAWLLWRWTRSAAWSGWPPARAPCWVSLPRIWIAGRCIVWRCRRAPLQLVSVWWMLVDFVLSSLFAFFFFFAFLFSFSPIFLSILSVFLFFLLFLSWCRQRI